jgi:sensor histidine kinase YesM
MVYIYIGTVTVVSVLALILLRKKESIVAREYLSTAIILFVVGCLMTLVVCQSCAQSFTRYISLSSFFGMMWIALWLGNAFAGNYISSKISWTVYPVRAFFILLAFTVTYTLLAVYAIVLFYRHVLGFHINVDEMIYSSLIITFLITMFMHGRSFLLGWRQSAIDAERLKQEGVAARYESLKNQVNPHFLFNSLNALSNLIYDKPDLAVKFVRQLSEVYRYVLDTKDQELVSKEVELKFLDSYIFLQKIRFDDNLRIQIDLKNTATSFPPLVLQMLIENAIKHNEISSENPLTISIYTQNEFVVVENNLQKRRSVNEASTGVGLTNIINRYTFLRSKMVQVIEGNEKFAVKLPIIYSKP